MKTEFFVTWAIAILGIAITVVVNYQNRRRARQNELFRKDPSVGIDPPPHPWMVFLRKDWYHIFYIVAIVFYFCRWMIQDAQHSYHAGVSAALYLFYMTAYGGTLILRRSGGLIQAVDWVSDDTNRAIKIIGVHNAMLLAVIHDLTKQGLLSENAEARIGAAMGEIQSAKE